MQRYMGGTWQRSVILAAFAAVLAGVPGCLGPLMVPMVRPLSEEQQDQVEQAWSNICTPPGKLDRMLLLDVLIAGQLHEAGVDSLVLTSRKTVRGGGSALMELRYDRRDPNAATYAVTFLDAQGRLARRELYTPEEINGRAQYLSEGGGEIFEPNNPTPEQREAGSRRRKEYQARIAEIRAVLGELCPREQTDLLDGGDEHPGAGARGADATGAAPSAEQRRARARGVASTVDELQGGKTPDEVLAVIKRHFGRPDRDVGSGLSIPQWDLADGLLTYNPACGPTLLRKGGSSVWLIKTHNALRENLLGSYELTTAPDAHSHRTWLGNVFLNPDGTYAFKGGGTDPNQVAGGENFFTDHPAGTFKAEYKAGLTETTLLETLTSQTAVAWLDFTAPNPGYDPNRAATSSTLDAGYVYKDVGFVYLITADPDGRRMSVSAPGEFELTKGWEHYWW